MGERCNFQEEEREEAALVANKQEHLGVLGAGPCDSAGSEGKKATGRGEWAGPAIGSHQYGRPGFLCCPRLGPPVTSVDRLRRTSWSESALGMSSRVTVCWVTLPQANVIRGPHVISWALRPVPLTA